ncbi:MAG: PilZ domain-containing protein [Spirochaetaceae bacterium]|nr:MAG: PilZ domain-containing protein [Spirochaetaceae bacterium]
MWIFLGIVTLLFIAFFVFVQRSGGFGFPWVQFYVRGKESGFKFGELNLLRRVAVENRLKNPTSLFWSERTLDRCIRGTIIRFRSEDKEEDEKAIEFLSKLFDFRKRVEFNLPKYRLGIQSTRSISAQQPIKITFPGGSVYFSKVVENMRKYLAIAYPKGKPLPFGVTWRGQKINVYFWRMEDAGYYFESRVLDDYLDRKFPILHIAHSDQLVRTQKRNSIRVKLDSSGMLFPMKSIQDANEEVSRSGGFRCKMVDISEDGAAIIVGGRAKPGLPVKLQTEIQKNPIIMSGTIKGVTYKENKNISILHIQAVPPSHPIKNTILTYVYGIFQDDPDGPSQMRSTAERRRR